MEEKKTNTENTAAEQKEKEWPKKITQLIAIATLFFAVCATFASLKAGGFSNKAILAQNQASDTWAYYQAKSMKETMYKIQLDQIDSNTNIDEEKRKSLKEKYVKTAERYAKEQEEITAEAKKYEVMRDESQIINQKFAGALTFLQIGILLLSLAALCKMLYFCYIGLAVGGFGAISFLIALLQI